MATVNLMNGFRDLYLDLSELSQNTDDLLESRLHDVERLRVELESRQAELRALLEKSPKNDESRESLSSGTSHANSPYLTGDERKTDWHFQRQDCG